MQSALLGLERTGNGGSRPYVIELNEGVADAHNSCNMPSIRQSQQQQLGTSICMPLHWEVQQ